VDARSLDLEQLRFRWAQRKCRHRSGGLAASLASAGVDVGTGRDRNTLGCTDGSDDRVRRASEQAHLQPRR
jgi:hypothetical protein